MEEKKNKPILINNYNNTCEVTTTTTTTTTTTITTTTTTIMERFTTASVNEMTEQFSSQIDLNPNENSATANLKTKKHFSLAEINKRISFFDGNNIDSSIFIDECEIAYRRTHPSNLVQLGYLIHSKISGEAIELFDEMEINYHNIILELKRVYIKPDLLDWIYELVIAKQEIYENPIKFGWRLKKMIEYARETYHKVLPRILANHQLLTVKNTALRIYTTKMYNKDFEEILRSQVPKDLDQAIKMAEKIYDSMALKYIVHSPNATRINSGNCPHCDDNEFHYFDCFLDESNLTPYVPHTSTN